MINKKYWIKSFDTNKTYLVAGNDMDEAIKRVNKLENKKGFGNVSSQLYDNDDNTKSISFDKFNYVTVE